jgi:hypothetical protein
MKSFSSDAGNPYIRRWTFCATTFLMFEGQVMALLVVAWGAEGVEVMAGGLGACLTRLLTLLEVLPAASPSAQATLLCEVDAASCGAADKLAEPVAGAEVEVEVAGAGEAA